MTRRLLDILTERSKEALLIEEFAIMDEIVSKTLLHMNMSQLSTMLNIVWYVEDLTFTYFDN